MIWRGLSGHCGLYQQLGIDTAVAESNATVERVEV
jgi:hypothetical protein